MKGIYFSFLIIVMGTLVMLSSFDGTDTINCNVNIRCLEKQIVFQTQRIWVLN